MAQNNPRLEAIKEVLDEKLKIQKQHSQELAKFNAEVEAKKVKEIERLKEDLERDLIDKLADLKAKGIKVEEKQRQELIKTEKARAEREERKKKAEARREVWANKAEALGYAYRDDGTKKSKIEQLPGQVLGALLNTGLAIENTLKAGLKSLEKAFDNGVNRAMSTYAQYQAGINARLQASGKSMSSLEKSMSKVAYSPLLKSETLYQNLSTLIQDGIVSNVEQRAFLMTIKDNIATTFDANNSAIKRIIRLQQQDSTASRLGLEAFLTRYMNQMVQNTEYLTTSFDNVQSALLEASSLMNMSGANEFEFQVQKWLGAMSGLGLSESTSSSLAQALGYLGSGNIESLGSSSLQNLLVMASARAGLSYSDMLKGGLGGNTTNLLLASIVDFVQDIWTNSKDNNVVLSQLSNTFGLTVSDVRAIANMSQKLENSLTQTNMNTSQMYGELGYQFNQMSSRMSIATLLENAFGNFAFQSGAKMASNPATYALWKIADYIGTTTGGINIPGTMFFNMNATVDQLLKLGLVGISTLSNIRDIGSAINSLGNGAALLKAMGIEQGTSIISRGADLSTSLSGFSTSQSAYMVNSNQQAFEAGAKMMMREQRESAIQENKNKNEVDLNTIDSRLLRIIELLDLDGIKIKEIGSIAGFSQS